MLRRSSRLLNKAAQNLRSFSSMPPEVIHDTENSMFYVDVDGEKAVLQYDKLNSVLELYETEVPEVHRGKGIAQILAKAAFDHIVENDLKMRVTCTYLQSYLERHPVPEYVSRVVE